MVPLRSLIQELLDSGVCRNDRTSKWSHGAWLIRPSNPGGNHIWLLIPMASLSGYAAIRQLDLVLENIGWIMRIYGLAPEPARAEPSQGSWDSRLVWACFSKPSFTGHF